MKDPEFICDFQIFWDAYPRRHAKKDALKAWRQLRPSTETVQLILEALTWQTQTDQWKRGIIPLAGTYLRGERLEDERPITAIPKAITDEQRVHAHRIHAQQRAHAQQIAQDAADDYYRTHPWATRPRHEE